MIVARIVGAGALGLLLAIAVLAGCAGDEASNLVADFSAAFDQPSTGPTSCPVQAIRFTDQSQGQPDAWRWDFGNGAMSTEQDPMLETSDILVDVTLTVSRGDAADSVSKRAATHEC